jgi:MFS family permease
VSPWYSLTLALLVLVGMSSTAFHTTANTSIQLATPDRLRGRVMGLYMLLFAGSTPIGGFLTGFLAQHLGVSMAVAIEAGVALLGVLAGLAYYRAHTKEIAATAMAAVSAGAG